MVPRPLAAALLLFPLALRAWAGDESVPAAGQVTPSGRFVQGTSLLPADAITVPFPDFSAGAGTAERPAPRPQPQPRRRSSAAVVRGPNTATPTLSPPAVSAPQAERLGNTAPGAVNGAPVPASPVVGEDGAAPAGAASGGAREGDSTGGSGVAEGAAGTRGSKAVSAAAKAADALKALSSGSLDAGELKAPAGPRGEGSAAAGASALAAGAPSPAAKPAALPGLAEARANPGPLAAAGLALAPDGAGGARIVSRKSGLPATAEQLGDLAMLLRAGAPSGQTVSYRMSQPAAYSGLVSGYEARPDLRDSVFKDAPIKADEDPRWSRKCKQVSGDCNKNASGSYDKEQPISPEELARMWEQVKLETAEAERTAGSQGGSRLRSGGLSGLLERLYASLGSEGEEEAGSGYPDVSAGAGASGRRGSAAGAAGKKAAGGRALEASEAGTQPRGRGGFFFAALLAVLGASIAHFGWLRREDRG